MDYKEQIYLAMANSELETSRLILRYATENDTDDMFEFGKDEQTVEHLTWGPLIEPQEALKAIRELYLPNPFQFIIADKADNRCIGGIDIRINEKHQKCEFGYVLNRAYWRRGYMSEVLDIMIKLAFGRLKLNRVEGDYFVGNEASGRVMEKCGMNMEGVSLEGAFIKGKFRDVVHYGLTASVYNGHRKIE